MSSMSLNAYILTINENGYQSIFTKTDVATQSQSKAEQYTITTRSKKSGKKNREKI